MRTLMAGLLVLALAAPAQAADRLVQGRVLREAPEAAGSALAWTTRDERVVVADGRGRVRYRLRLGDYGYCRVADAREWGEALVGCTDTAETAHAFLVTVRSGAVRELAIRGFPEALGRHWIETFDQPPGCDRCGSIVYTNRRTGEEDRRDSYDEADRDLDRRRRVPPPGTWRMEAYDGRRWIELRSRGAGERLWLRGTGRRRLVGTCRWSCFAVDLTGPLVSYADAGARTGGTLHRLDLRTGVRRSWSFPRRTHWHERPLVVCGTPLLVSETYYGKLRLWHPPRGRARC